MNELQQPAELYSRLIPFVTFACIALLITASLSIPFVRKLWRNLFSFAAGVLVLVFSLWSMVFWKPTVWVFGRIIPVTPLAVGFEALLALLGRLSPNPLAQGERLKAAQLLWPRSKFGFLYQNVPADIRRPLVEDGKLVGGIPTTWLADRYVTSAAPRAAVTLAIFSFLEIFVPALILCVASGLLAFATALGNVFGVARPVIERWPGLPDQTVGSMAWYSFLSGRAFSFLWGNLIANTLVLEHWALLALGISLILIPGVVYSWRAAKGSKYQMHTKDADVRWPYRAETREVLNTTYNRQVELASGYLKDSPLFSIGEATGILRLRGDLSAPIPGQTIALDRDSLFQHLLVLGGTGEGKTSGVLRPLMRQLLAIRHYGMYVCDAKGVLWMDAFKIAEETGRSKDVVIIGTGAGQFGVDPIAELTPSQVVATLRSVLQQISGGSSESFWPDMAANVLRHVFTVAKSYATTDAGLAETKAGVNPYSLWWAYQAVLNEKMLTEAIEILGRTAATLRASAKAATNEAEFSRVKQEFATLQPPDLIASVRYLTGAWKAMANETKTGIIAHVTQLLDGFSGAHTLRDRFASGRSKDGIHLSEALRGKIVLNALSSVEDGLPARLVIMLLKTTLYREARVRESEWKASKPPKNPQDAPCVVFMDEVQEIVSADPTSGLSDATFWNVARSSGLAGIFATQTIAALEQALGKEAATNFLQQARSKIFFRSEDKVTVEYACWCAGQFERDRVYEDGLFESVEFKELLTGQSYFEPVNDKDAPTFGFRFFFQMASNLIRHRQFGWDILPVKPFIGTEASAPTSAGDSALSAFSANRQAAWREEDREWRYRTTGNTIVAALTPADMIGMGRWHAYAHIQRAGAVRQDLVLVRHEHG
jgi:hypothetical protein